jgi:hypothetical protein
MEGSGRDIKTLSRHLLRFRRITKTLLIIGVLAQIRIEYLQNAHLEGYRYISPLP